MIQSQIKTKDKEGKENKTRQKTESLRDENTETRLGYY